MSNIIPEPTIDHADGFDLNAPFFLRFSSTCQHLLDTQYQHILHIGFFYGHHQHYQGLPQGFVRLKRYKNGFLDKETRICKEIDQYDGRGKLFYYSYALYFR